MQTLKANILSVSAWAGGYTEQLAIMLVDGAQKFFKDCRCATVSFPVEVADGAIGEENFMAEDPAVQDDWSANELPEWAREDL